METLRYVLLANGLLIVVSVAFYVLLRRETFFHTNRLMLWLGVLSLLILPALQFPDWRPQRVRSAMQHTAQVIAPSVLPQAPLPPPVTVTFPNGRSYPVTSIRRLARFGWSWQLALIGLYLAGVGVLFIRFLIQLFSIQRLIRRSDREPFDTFTLVTNSKVDAPFSFFRWVVLNPARHAGDELEQILRHERVHVRQRHSLDMLMAEVVCIIFWMNPAAYLFRKLVHQTLEFCADRAVLAEGIDARSYQYSLLKVSLSSGPMPVTNSFGASELRDRIRMMNRQRSRWFQALKYPVVMVLSLGVVTAFARHKAEQIATQVAEPAAQSIRALSVEAGVDETREIAPPESLSLSTVDEPVTVDTSAHLLTAATVSPALTDSAQRSPSRLVVYRDSTLYWIITPKTTLADFGLLQQELAKHNHQLQVRSIKYDPSYTFIDQIDVTVAKISGGSTGSNDTLSDGGKPIKTIVGYADITAKGGARGIGTLSTIGYLFPAKLRSTASSDEEIVAADLLKPKNLESLLDHGYSRFHLLGTAATRFDRAYFENKSTKNSGILVKPDKSLTIDEDSKTAKVFINNQPVDGSAVEMWSVDKLYAVVKKTQYDPVSKRMVTVGLLLYMIDK